MLCQRAKLEGLLPDTDRAGATLPGLPPMLRQQEAVLLDVSRPRSEFRPGDIIDIETEDGMEVDVTVL
eukprot:COSAG01_NODE_55430_length_325_cov_0.681416_1_plen_67_part_10